MTNFWDYEVWSFFLLLSLLLLSLLVANLLKKSFVILRNSLIPTSVLGGILLLGVSLLFEAITKEKFFNLALFGGDGYTTLESLTYHCLALGFIASTFKSSGASINRNRAVEVFNTGLTTVSTYLLQAILGFGITILFSYFIPEVFAASGCLLSFGYGQGTGQALNYGSIYESQYGFIGGRSFGLTIAAFGFLSASIGGVIHLLILRRRRVISTTREEVIEAINSEQIQSPDEIPMNGSIDKMTVQVAIVFASYVLAYLFLLGFSALLPNLRAVLYGFNFLLGVIMASAVKFFLRKLRKHGVVKKEYVNPFLMNRLCGFFFDLMIAAGIAAIQISFLANTWYILLLLGVVGALSTYWYNYRIAKKLFPGYTEEQFLVMYGMLTGTASTGMILLREVDPSFVTPAADNLIYQNFPAIVFGFPLMLLATLAPQRPILTLIILVVFFLFLNVLLFRSRLPFFRSKKRNTHE